MQLLIPFSLSIFLLKDFPASSLFPLLFYLYFPGANSNYVRYKHATTEWREKKQVEKLPKLLRRVGFPRIRLKCRICYSNKLLAVDKIVSIFRIFRIFRTHCYHSKMSFCLSLIKQSWKLYWFTSIVALNFEFRHMHKTCTHLHKYTY